MELINLTVKLDNACPFDDEQDVITLVCMIPDALICGEANYICPETIRGEELAPRALAVAHLDRTDTAVDVKAAFIVDSGPDSPPECQAIFSCFAFVSLLHSYLLSRTKKLKRGPA
jgi:hypothetical protein